MPPDVPFRLNDPKESVEQQCLAILKLSGQNYSNDSLLPALIRSLETASEKRLHLSLVIIMILHPHLAF